MKGDQEQAGPTAIVSRFVLELLSRAMTWAVKGGSRRGWRNDR